MSLLRIIILGPTASGKSVVAFELAKMFESVIISADSRQCFRQMDIGTAKPEKEMLEEIHHYNISNLNPGEKDTVRAFRSRCDLWEDEITSPYKIYAGGSTLHLQSVLFDFDDVPDSNPENLDKLSAQAEKSGLETLYAKLKEVDPEYAARMDGLNRHRIYRALDVWMQTGKPFSSFHSGFTEDNLRPGSVVFGLEWSREILHQRINERVDMMIEAGLEREIRNLLKSGVSEEDQVMKTVGYREMLPYLKGESSFESAVEQIKTNTRRYARRQLTWFRRWDFVRWIPAQGKTSSALAEQIRDHIKKVEADQKTE